MPKAPPSLGNNTRRPFMTRYQRVAWLNLAFFAMVVAVLVLEQLGAWAGGLPLLLLALAGSIATIAMLARKDTVVDERDRSYGNRSIIAGYFALLLCLFAGALAAAWAFPGASIPLRFLYLLAGGSWAVSMLVQAIATLVQYRRGS
jgi:hypothetical protein